jgi:hypothetical protein
MQATRPIHTKVQVIMTRLSPFPDDLTNVGCLRCGKALELLQPEKRCSDRLVGVCDSCGYWYVLDLSPGADEVVMVLLPDTRDFQYTEAG